MHRQVSLLRSEGHPEAAFYPLGRIYEEAELVVERQNRNIGTLGILMEAVISAQPNPVVKTASTKSMRRRFNDLIKNLMGD